jgi:tRNA G18 (ribose-2'-O)-methylase SpoU
MTQVMTFQSQEDINQQINPSNRSIAVLLDNIRSAHNVGAIFRTADAVGISKINLCGITPTPLDNDELQKTALGAELSIPWEHHQNGYLFANDLKKQGYRLIALELHPSSIPLYDLNLHSMDHRPVVLIVGNERAGVDPGIIAFCDDVVSLPMLGEKRSLNVSVAFGVAAYHLVFC